MTPGERAGAHRDHTVVLALCVVAIAAAGLADLFTPRDVAFGGMTVAVVAVASLVLSRRAVSVVLACAVLGRAAAAAAGSIPPAVAALDCGVAVMAALTLLRIRHTRAAVEATARCPLQDRPVTVTWDLLDVAQTPAPGNGRPDAVTRPRCSVLSVRELQVMDLALRGLTARQVGEHLHLGERTVETYMARVYAKCGVCSRAELAELILDHRGAAPHDERRVTAPMGTTGPAPAQSHLSVLGTDSAGAQARLASARAGPDGAARGTGRATRRRARGAM